MNNTLLSAELGKFSTSLRRVPGVPAQVADFLRELIIGGSLKPGERLAETKIAQELGIGQPTVREAMNALVEEGLVVRQPNRGCSVVELTRTEIKQIFRLRIALEPLAAEMALEQWADWKGELLLTALESLRQADAEKDIPKFYRRDIEFHRTLWSLAENPFLVKALSQITVPLFAFVILRLAAGGTIDTRDALAQHERITEAVLSGDIERAVRVLGEEVPRFDDWGKLFMTL